MIVRCNIVRPAAGPAGQLRGARRCWRCGVRRRRVALHHFLHLFAGLACEKHATRIRLACSPRGARRCRGVGGIANRVSVDSRHAKPFAYALRRKRGSLVPDRRDPPKSSAARRLDLKPSCWRARMVFVSEGYKHGLS